MTKAAKYSDNYIQKQVVDLLEKDGAICNYYSKYYKEKETYNGGTGDRYAFKLYNDRIIKYQNIIKILTGEQRANIYESIPAIDFANPEFTSFMYTYPLEINADNSTEDIDSQRIIPVESNSTVSAEELIESEDKFTINRALAGEDTAEYFYNTKGLISTYYDLQVSPYTVDSGKCKYIYNGVVMSKDIEGGSENNGVRETELKVFTCNSDMELYFTDKDPQDEVRLRTIGEKSYIVDTIPSADSIFNKSYKEDGVVKEQLSIPYKSTYNKVLNVDCTTTGNEHSGWTPYTWNKDTLQYEVIEGYETKITHSNEEDTIIKEVQYDSIEYKYRGHFILNLKEGDIIFAIPSNAYTTDSTKLLILKSNETTTVNDDGDEETTLSKVNTTFNYTLAYYNSINQMFYEDSNYTIALRPKEESYYVPIDNETTSNVYYYNQYSTLYENIPESEVISIDASSKTFVRSVPSSKYSCYALYTEGLQKDLTLSSMFTAINVGDDISDFVKSDVYSAISDYIDVSVKYITNASGLLAGYFSQPYSYEVSNGFDTVKEWVFVNERDTALEKGVSIDVGSKYYSGHLLNRGDIIESPLKLTSKDSYDGISYNNLPSKKGIYGKASLIYHKLMDANLYDTMFSSHRNQSWGNQKTYLIGSIVSKSDYGNTDMVFAKKLNLSTSNTNAIATYNDIATYINNLKKVFTGDTMNIDSSNDYVLYSSAVKNEQHGIFWSNTSFSKNEQDLFSSNQTDLNTAFLPCVLFNYEKYTSNGYCSESTYNFNKVVLQFITPRRLFERSGINNNDVIVVFPDDKKYFPEKVFVFSRYDLNLDSSGLNNVCSFYKDNKLLMFKVSNITKILPSVIKKIVVREGTDNVKEATIDEMALGWVGYVKNKNVDTVRANLENPENSDDPEYAESFKTSFLEFKNIFSEKNDCYVYELSYLTCPSLEKFEIYDADNNLIKSDENSVSNQMLPFYYTTSNNREDTLLFTLVDSTSRTHLLKNYNKYKDYKAFESGSIISGIPQYIKTKVNNKYIWYGQSILGSSSTVLKGFQSVFISMLNNYQSENSSIIQGLIKNTIFNWKVSTSKLNPITIAQLPEILKGIISFSEDIRDISESGVTLSSNGKVITLNKSMFANLLYAIDNSRTIGAYDIVVSSAGTVDTSDSDIQALTSESTAEELQEVYNIKINNLVQNINVSLQLASSSNSIEKHSIRELDNVLGSFITASLENSSNLSKENCELIDRYLGNNTSALISIGDSYTTRNTTIEYTPKLQEAREKISDTLTKVVVNVAQTIANKVNNSSLSTMLDTLKSSYSSYYTTESINKGITLSSDGTSVSINRDVLIPSKNNISLLTNAYRTYLKRRYYVNTGLFIFRMFSLMNPRNYDTWYKSEIQGGKNTSVISIYTERLKEILDRLEKSALTMPQGVDFNYDTVRKYIDGETTSSSAVAMSYVSVGGTTNNRIRLNITPPQVTFKKGVIQEAQDTTDKDIEGVVGIQLVSNESSKLGKSLTISNNFNEEADVSENALWALVDFTKTALDGTNKDDAFITYSLKNVGTEDSEPTGRETSLYYKRYQILNNRMNRIQGNLWTAAMLLRNSKVVKDTKRLNTQSVECYSPFLDVMPIQSMESMTYLPTQKALMSSDIINGKFYSDKELEEMRKLINDRCVLTCTKCMLKDSCPFYSQEEVIKMYCSGIESVSFWIKDNELDLLVYEQDVNGNYILPKITTNSDMGTDMSRLTDVHIPYSEILERTDISGNTTQYKIRDMDNLREKLESEPKLQYSDYVKDDLGWLLGARYGTVQKNNISDLVDTNDELYQYKNKIHPYKYLYDAVYIEDEESYVNYTPSQNIYKTELDITLDGKENHYDIETKIKIPSSLKIFSNSNPDDDVYLISDDTVDSNGEAIIPIIYLGKVKNMEYVFDLTDDGIQGGVKDPDDSKLYAADVAQWCVNYYKGTCYKNPIGETQGNIPDTYTNHDQYWMENVYKKITKDGKDTWYKFNGRKRELSGFSIPLIDVENYDEVLAISGRPLVADYINFLRKVSIRIYNRETSQWTIPWINENLKFVDESRYFKGLDTLEKKCEKQRSVLPLMKTNLRLAIVHN